MMVGNTMQPSASVALGWNGASSKRLPYLTVSAPVKPQDLTSPLFSAR